MLRWKKKIRKITYFLTDFICLLMAFILSELTYVGVQDKSILLSGFERIAFVLLFVLSISSGYLILNVYDQTIEDSGRIRVKTLIKMLISLAAGNIFMGAMLFYMHVNLARGFMMNFSLFLLGLTIVNRIILKHFNGNSISNKNRRNILVVGHSERGHKYIDEIKKHDYLNYNLMGYICIKEKHHYGDLPLIGCINELLQICTDYVIDEIAVARPLSYDESLPDILEACQRMGITVTMLLETHNKGSKAQVAMIGDLPVLKFHTVSLNESQIFAKRVMDVCGGLVGLILFGLAYLMVGPLIKVETPGPIIFKQDRVGKNGRVFKVWKFRSMGVNAEAEKLALMDNNEMSGHMFKMSHDPRVTKIGAFIRKTSIDELPQFVNVLWGDMSLVGTRPPTVDEVKDYETDHMSRISITPGITGNWQVSGRSDIEDFEEVVRLDREYIKDWSVWMDINILVKTVLVVLKRDGSK
jgi:exopolysaccharide biosynthesis polyprenyl glycosylphosphotransferase